jgi:glycosyltransferase involved in cell wall biosynthesis
VLTITIACPTRVDFHLGSERETGLGGIETASLELARALARRGHAVALATRTHARRDEPNLVNLPLSELASRPCDVLISCNDASVFDAQARAPSKVLWLHNPLPVEKAIRRGQIGPFWRHRPAAVFVGTMAERSMTSLYPFRSRVVIPHGVGEVFLHTDPRQPRRRRFVFASQRQRGLAPTLAAWRRHVAPAEPEAEFHIFGTGAAEMGIGEAEADRERLVFHPRRRKDDLAAFYAEAWAMIYPGAHDETFCIAAAEAQAVGLPVVTMGIGALSERVQHGVNGLLSRSFDELGRSAARLARDDGLWRLLHQGALLQREVLSWDRVAALWEALVLSPAPLGQAGPAPSRPAQAVLLAGGRPHQP